MNTEVTRSELNGLGKRVSENRTNHLLLKVATEKDVDQIKKEMTEAKAERSKIWENIDTLNRMAGKVLGGVFVINVIIQVVGIYIIAKILK